MTLFRTIGTVCALVALTGCATDPAPPQAESVPGEAQETEPALRGAVLILFDTLRADHLSCYGYSRATSPVIDSLVSAPPPEKIT